jgi:hypothetical protein
MAGTLGIVKIMISIVCAFGVLIRVFRDFQVERFITAAPSTVVGRLSLIAPGSRVGTFKFQLTL